MDTGEDRTFTRRIATALIMIGAACWGLAGIALTRLVQSGQPLPGWAITLLIMGGLLFIIGIVLLVISPAVWHKIGHSIKYLPMRLYKFFLWSLYKPSYRINDPVFSSRTLQISQNYYEREITAGIGIWIKNRNKHKQVRIRYSTTHICLKQKVGWEERSCQFKLYTHKGFPEVTLQPGEEWVEQILVTTKCSGNIDSLPDFNRNYQFGVWGIIVSLPGQIMKELHKGIKCDSTMERYVTAV